MSDNDEAAYRQQVAHACAQAQQLKLQHPQADFQDLFHYFMNLTLTPDERLAKSLERSGARRIFAS